MRLVWGGICLFGGLCGCQSGTTFAELSPPTYDAEQIAQNLLRELDRNKNGAVDQAEAKEHPAMQHAFARFDRNNDRKVTVEEIQARVAEYAELARNPVGLGCLVTWNGQPLAGATLTFEPDAVMGSSLKTATGVTDNRGYCESYTIEGKTYRGLPPGLYRIQVRKEGVAIPERYNTKTTLGREIYHDPRSAEAILELKLVGS